MSSAALRSGGRLPPRTTRPREGNLSLDGVAAPRWDLIPPESDAGVALLLLLADTGGSSGLLLNSGNTSN